MVRGPRNGEERIIKGVWRDGANGEYWFDAAHADYAADFFPDVLKHDQGEWFDRPFTLQSWQADATRAIFGWKQLANHRRRFVEVFIFVPSGNGKSAWLSGLALFLLLYDSEPRAEVFNVAADRHQARIVFDTSRRMVESSSFLSRKVKPFRHSLIVPADGSSYQVLSADAELKHGLRPHVVLIDEVHVLRDRRLRDNLVKMTAKRRQPLVIQATTAGFDRLSLCGHLYDYAKKVRDGVTANDRFLPIIYEAPRDSDGNYADWKDEKTLRIANPNLDVTIKLKDLQEEMQRAVDDPSEENTFKRLRLNIWTEQNTRWMSVDKWNACQSALSLRAFAESLYGQHCLGGGDFAENQDLNSLALFFPATGEVAGPEQAQRAEGQEELDKGPQLPPGIHGAIWRHWAPADIVAERVRKARVDYDIWSRGCICRTIGDAERRVKECPAILHLTPGAVTDFEFIRADINALASLYQIAEIAIDPHQAAHLMTLLEQDGLSVFKHLQWCTAMNPGIKELARILLGKQFEHGGDPCARWAFSNVVIYQNSNGEKKFDKRKATEKIDPMVALVMPVGRAALMADSSNVVQGAVLL